MTIKNQRDGIYREGIFEHFLLISKQTPKPSTSIECGEVVCAFKNQTFSE